MKDVLYHLYKTARGNLQRLVPKEMRILKYLLTIEDPEERMSALNDAFTPGDELEGMDVDCLYTCVFEHNPCFSAFFSFNPRLILMIVTGRQWSCIRGLGVWWMHIISAERAPS